MKVTMPRNYRSTFTLEEYDVARRIIAMERDDEETPKGWAEYAANEILRDSGDCLREVLTASAEIARNCRVWNAYDEDSGRMDVWINFTALTYDGFIEGGAYLSDIWQSGSVPYAREMYVRRAKWAD